MKVSKRRRKKKGQVLIVKNIGGKVFVLPVDKMKRVENEFERIQKLHRALELRIEPLDHDISVLKNLLGDYVKILNFVHAVAPLFDHANSVTRRIGAQGEVK